MLLTFWTLLLMEMDMSWLISSLGAIFVGLSIVKVYMDIRYHPGRKNPPNVSKSTEKPRPDAKQ